MAEKGKGKENGKRSEEIVKEKAKKEGLAWSEWIRGWLYLAYEILFQRIVARNLKNPMPLPPINDRSFIVTGSTSGIGKEIARQLAEAGGHVVMAVRNPNAANELIRKRQGDWSGKGLPLNIEVMELDLLSLDSVVRFAEAWNARSGPLHALINNAGIFSIGGFVDPEDMNVTSGKRKFTSLVGYSSSKLAEIMFGSVLNKRLPAEAGINVVCVSPGIVKTNVTRDLPKIVQAGYHLIPYFICSPAEGSRSALFAATDPKIGELCESLKSKECAFINRDCQPANPSQEAHNVETSFKVWEKTLELIGLPSDAVQRLLEGLQFKCKYGASYSQ